MPNPIVHFEITGPDGAKLQKFYGDLFGWNVDANNQWQYGMVDTGGESGINGGIAADMEGGHRVTIYAAVTDIPAALEKAVSLGGTVLMPEGSTAASVRRSEEKTPLGEVGTPEDVAEALIYLLRADYVTGETLVVDGGRMVRA